MTPKVYTATLFRSIADPNAFRLAFAALRRLFWCDAELIREAERRSAFAGVHARPARHAAADEELVSVRGNIKEAVHDFAELRVRRFRERRDFHERAVAVKIFHERHEI